MSSRFLAAAGPREALEALQQGIESRSAGSLVRVFDKSSLAVWIVPGTPVAEAADGNGILIGRLFDRASGARTTSLPGSEPARIIDRYWGPYVLLAGDGTSHLVLRDPSGAVPVYYGAQQGAEVYASDAGLLELAWPVPFRADLDFIRHWLTFPFLRSARTGAQGVRELLPGMRRRVGLAGEELHQAWSPHGRALRDPAVAEFGDAAKRLRQEAVRTVAALARDGGDIAVQLSGGLDSSIVAAALSVAGIRFRAITYATLAADGDERRFAREIARRCGAELVELVEEPGPTTLELAAASPLRPPPNPLLQPLHRAVALRLALLGADLVLDGAGGDSVFAFLNTASPALDALRRRGPLQAVRTLRDIAEVHGCTFWRAARSALRRGRLGATSRWPRETRFLAAGAALESPDPHPWLSVPSGLLPGTADQLRMIVGIHHFLPDPAPASPATLHPLLAQPLLELCLGIPSWLWFAGGRDRAVARQAFRGLIPDVILQRRRKGSLESMLVRSYMRSRAALERFLLDGNLAANGIIDADAVSAYLRQETEPRDLSYVRLLEIAAAEQWLRSFCR